MACYSTICYFIKLKTMKSFSLLFTKFNSFENRTYTVVKQHLQNVRRLNQLKVHTAKTNLQADVSVDGHRHVHARKSYFKAQ